MQYWNFAFHNAWKVTWESIFGGALGVVIGVGFFIFTLFWSHRLRGKKELKEWAFDGLIALCSTLTLGILFFIIQLLVFVPMYSHSQAVAAIKTAGGVHSEDKKETADLENALKAANDRATRFSDALVMGKRDLRDESIASAIASVSINVSPNKDRPPENARIPQGGFICFIESGTLLAAATHESIYLVGQDETGIVSLNFLDQADFCPTIGKPLSALYEAKYIQINLASGILPANAHVTGGHVAWVINGSIRLTFTIPPQNPAGDGEGDLQLIISDLSDGFKPLSPTSTP